MDPISRRRFIKLGIGAAVVGVPSGILAYTLEFEPHWLEIVHRPLAVRGLPDALAGRTLAQLSDIHIGPQVRDAFVLESFAKIKALQPDIVVYTGDYISYRPARGEATYTQLRDVFRQSPRGRLATIGVLGNHDYGTNWSELPVARRVAAEVERAGVQMLSNDVATVAGLDFIGVDDLWAHQSDSRAALARRTSDAAIVLCHNPDAQDALDWGDYSGWVLAGHTHGGQCKAPFLPPPLLPVKNKRYVKGEVAVNERRTLYINRGLGHLIQARFNVRPEITVFTLRRADG
jgi:predicted MPP superfamily phosphohydrolase